MHFQERQWREDPNQFVSDDEDEANMRSMRTITLKVISELIEKHGDEAIQALIVIAEKFMMNYDEQHTVSTVQEFLQKQTLDQKTLASLMDFDKEKLMYFVRTSNFDCEHPDHAWKKREVALLVLGSFSEDIIVFQTKHSSTFDLALLIQNLMYEMDNPLTPPILRARTLWTVTKFCEIVGVKHKELFVPLLKISILCLSPANEIPVRLIAAKSASL